LSDCYSGLAVYGFVPSKGAFPRAKKAAQRALELDDTLAEAHASLAYVEANYDWDWSGAERESQRAISINPGYANAHRVYGQVLRDMGRLEEATAEGKRARELDPLSLVINRSLGTEFYVARQYDQAIDLLRKALELDPNYVPAHLTLGMAYLGKSMYKEGVAEFQKALVIAPGSTGSLDRLGYAYAIEGKSAEALRVLDRLNELSKQKYVPAGYRAMIYVGLGEKDKAFEWLEKSYEERYVIGEGAADIKVDPVFDPLRSDPRFADLLRRMNLQP
jgi:tetratricopeptide (TPR) repeat protein